MIFRKKDTSGLWRVEIVTTGGEVIFSPVKTSPALEYAHAKNLMDYLVQCSGYVSFALVKEGE